MGSIYQRVVINPSQLKFITRTLQTLWDKFCLGYMSSNHWAKATTDVSKHLSI